MSPFIKAYNVNKLPEAEEKRLDLQNIATPKNAYPHSNGRLLSIVLATCGNERLIVLPRIEYSLVLSMYLINPIHANMHPIPIGSSLVILTAKYCSLWKMLVIEPNIWMMLPNMEMIDHILKSLTLSEMLRSSHNIKCSDPFS
jgi:hypothetical protein